MVKIPRVSADSMRTPLLLLNDCFFRRSKFENGWRLELGPAGLAVNCIVRVLCLARDAYATDDRHSRNRESLACAFVEVELVSSVTAEPRNMIALECPFSLGRSGNGASASRAIEEEFLPRVQSDKGDI